MNPNTVVELRDAAIYHANDAFREASFKGHKGVQNLILSDVNLSVYPGEMVYLIGRVGSGKSSLLKTLYAELPLREGYGSVVGFDLRRIRRKDVPYLRRRMGIVFQDYRLLTDRNVFMNLHFVLRATGWRNELQIRSKIAEVLDMVSLHNKEYKMPYELSGGDLAGWVSQMNTLSQRIGTTNSTWTDACGLDSGNTTTAVDMYLILRYLMSFDAFKEISAAPTFTPRKSTPRALCC